MASLDNSRVDAAYVDDGGLDEASRRYYLDAMGIQCWQLLDSQQDSLLQNSTAADEGATQKDSQQSSWPQLEVSVQECAACDLHKQRQQAVLGRGNQSAELMFVLLSPSTNDDSSGILCSGEEDVLLTKMLAAINVPIADVYITSLLKCSSPAAHTISTNEVLQCNVHLKKQVQMVKPKVLVALGETTIQCLLKQNSTIDVFRDRINAASGNGGHLEEYFESIPLFVSYSPRELLQQAANKRKAWLDLQQLQKHFQGEGKHGS